MLLRRYSPPAILINQSYEIRQFRGNLGRYLEPSPGPASLNLRNMATASFFAYLKAAVLKASKRNEPIRKEGIRVYRNEHPIIVDVEVIPCTSVPSGKFFVIVFGESAQIRNTKKAEKSIPLFAKEDNQTMLRLKRQVVD